MLVRDVIFQFIEGQISPRGLYFFVIKTYVFDGCCVMQPAIKG